MAQRKIIEIDEDKCDGCGICAKACAEGAIQIRDGKARLVSEIYCDGLGACLGECPQGAITIIEREAEAFDEEATRRHLAGLAMKERLAAPEPQPLHLAHGGCPGSAARSFQLPTMPGVPLDGRNAMPGQQGPGKTPTPQAGEASENPSALSHWPVQLRLVPPNAAFFQDADLLLVADCVPFAYADFHGRFLRGRPIVIGCPKLDDKQAALDKLSAILSMSRVRSLTVVHMEVPCCTGLVHIAQAALANSGCDVPLEDVTISVRGQVLAAGPNV
jgi:Pyruvate/2-oxoacid:ferredoxin oxidoreductase delta subunit